MNNKTISPEKKNFPDTEVFSSFNIEKSAGSIYDIRAGNDWKNMQKKERRHQ